MVRKGLAIDSVAPEYYLPEHRQQLNVLSFRRPKNARRSAPKTVLSLGKSHRRTHQSPMLNALELKG
jgi:hypothetical protein